MLVSTISEIPHSQHIHITGFVYKMTIHMTFGASPIVIELPKLALSR